MSVPIDTCLQCDQTRATVKANDYYCATVDYYGECQEEWPRHRWADWTDTELARLGVLPEFMHLYRRHNERDLLQFIDCTHRGREHTPWDGNPDDGPPPYVCIACWTDTRMNGENNE